MNAPLPRSPRFDLPADGLARGLRRLLEPDEPLPAGVLLLPGGLDPVLPAALRAAAALLVAVVFAAGLLRDEATGLRGIYGVVALVGLVAAVRPGRRALRAGRDRLALERARWRRGLFVDRDALLLWDGSRAALLPRGSVEELRVRPGTPAGAERVPATTLACWKDGAGASGELDLGIPPRAADDGSDDRALGLHPVLVAWRDGVVPVAPAPGPGLGAWLRNVALGHAVALGLGLGLLLLLGVVARLVGRPAGALLGLLVGVPVFLLFPLVVDRAIGSRLARSGPKGRPVGWGYLLLLGLATLLVVIAGGEAVGRVGWQLRAEVGTRADLAAIAAAAGRPIFHPAPRDLRVLPEPLGHDVHRMHLGDARRVVRHAWVLPLVDPSAPEPGCLWLGVSGSEQLESPDAARRLLADPAAWLVEATGLEQAGYRDAVRDARAASPGALDGACARTVVLEASASRAEVLGSSVRGLAGLLVGAHVLPLLLLLAWAAWRRDRSRPVIGYPPREDPTAVPPGAGEAAGSLGAEGGS